MNLTDQQIQFISNSLELYGISNQNLKERYKIHFV